MKVGLVVVNIVFETLSIGLLDIICVYQFDEHLFVVDGIGVGTGAEVEV